jgi:threonine/homoserine/homoserine lactone efflux protein
MDTEALLALIGAGLALVGSPGPNTMSLAAAGAAFGVQRSFPFMAGLAIGMLAVIVIVASGTVAMLLAVPGIAPVLAVAAVVYFVYLAWKIATAKPATETTAQGRAPSTLAGVLQSLVNPKGYAAMLALFAGHTVLTARPLADAVLKTGICTAIIVLVNVVWLFVGTGLGRTVRTPRASRILNLTFAVLLLASAVALLPL